MTELSNLGETLLAILQNSRGWNAALLALGAFAIYVIGTNTAWRVGNAPESGMAKTMRAWSAKRGVRALYQLVRLAYYLGLPFAALYLGWIDLRSVGLGALDWAEGMRWAIVILLAAWLLLMLIWLPYLRATMDVPAVAGAQASFPRRMVEMIYMQAHWIFYRAAAITLFTGVLTDAFYWGAVAGLGLTSVEALLDPRLRARLQSIGTADSLIWNFGQAFINAVGFLATHNLFLGLMIQFLLELTVPHLRAARAVSRNLPAAPKSSPANPAHK
jgi:hypothetical protein